MNWIIKLSLSNMRKRRSRTVLTILGIVIGIISVVSMISIGFGASRTLMEMLDKESNSKEITVTSAVTSGREGDGNVRKDRLLNDKTVEKLKGINGVAAVYPVIEINPDERMGTYSGFATVRGVPAEYMGELTLKDGEAVSGRSSGLKVIADEGTKEIFISEKTWASFKDSPEGKLTLAGKRVRIKQYASSTDADPAESDMEITGVTDNEYSYYFYTDIENMKSYLRRNSGASNDWNYTCIIVRADSLESVEDVSASIKNLGFQVDNNKKTVDTYSRITAAVRTILGAIGVIAFAIAVIGIINTMTTSVYDRMQEIGVMKMIGCDSEDIMLMFLFEAGVLGFLGGVTGVLISYMVNELIINRVVVKMLMLPEGTVLASLPWHIALGAVIFATLISVIAGAVPARHAAGLRPLDAATSIK